MKSSFITLEIENEDHKLDVDYETIQRLIEEFNDSNKEHLLICGEMKFTQNEYYSNKEYNKNLSCHIKALNHCKL